MKTIALIVVCSLLVACSRSQDKISPDVLMKVDMEFSRMSADSGMQKAFLKYMDQKGVMLRDNQLPLEGRDQLASSFATVSDTAFIMTWSPAFADVAASGDLGYTYGFYKVKMRSDTSILLDEGTYLSVWKLQEEGDWKFVLDTGNKGLGKR